MKVKHTSKKAARRPFTGVSPNKMYNWFTVQLTPSSNKIGVQEQYFPMYAKLPKPTYKNLINNN